MGIRELCKDEPGDTTCIEHAGGADAADAAAGRAGAAAEKLAETALADSAILFSFFVCVRALFYLHNSWRCDE